MSDKITYLISTDTVGSLGLVKKKQQAENCLFLLQPNEAKPSFNTIFIKVLVNLVRKTG